MVRNGFSGTYVAIVTPMLAGGGVDWHAWDRLIDFHADNGTAGVIVGGTTGESPTLGDAELRELVLQAQRCAAGRLQILAGAGTNSTAGTVGKVRELSALGVDGLLLATPAYNKPTQEGLYQHYAAAAAASSVPLMLYNVPGRTSVDMLPATVARLAVLPHIVAIKEAVASLDRIRELRALCPPQFQILSGDDPTVREAMALGACGVVSVTANVAPALMSRMIAAAGRGETALAAELDARLAGLHQHLFVEANPIPVKWAMARMGLIGDTLRLPLTELSPQCHAVVLDAMRQADITPAA